MVAAKKIPGYMFIYIYYSVYTSVCVCVTRTRESLLIKRDTFRGPFFGVHFTISITSRDDKSRNSNYYYCSRAAGEGSICIIVWKLRRSERQPLNTN